MNRHVVLNEWPDGARESACVLLVITRADSSDELTCPTCRAELARAVDALFQLLISGVRP